MPTATLGSWNDAERTAERFKTGSRFAIVASTRDRGDVFETVSTIASFVADEHH